MNEQIVTTERGFQLLEWTTYNGELKTRLVQESSGIGDYVDALDNPGSSYLWIGKDHHLNREEVRELTGILVEWLTKKRLTQSPKSD